MSCGRTGADGAADQDSGAAADEASDEHTAGCAAAGFEGIAAIVAWSFELAFLIDVGAANVGVGQRRVEEVALAGGKDDGLGKNSDGGPVRRCGAVRSLW